MSEPSPEVLRWREVRRHFTVETVAADADDALCDLAPEGDRMSRRGQRSETPNPNNVGEMLEWLRRMGIKGRGYNLVGPWGPRPKEKGRVNHAHAAYRAILASVLRTAR